MKISGWCWKGKKIVLCHSKMERGEPCSRYIFSKQAKAITLVKKRWFSSKVFRIQDGQEYMSIEIVCDANIKQYFAPYYTALWPLRSTVNRLYLEKEWPWGSFMTKGSLSTLSFAIKTHIKDGNCLLWHFWQYQSYQNLVDHLTVQRHFYGWNNWVALASILDFDTFIDEQPVVTNLF